MIPAGLILAALIAAVPPATGPGLHVLDRPGVRVIFAEAALASRAEEVAALVPPLVEGQARALGIEAPERIAVSLVDRIPEDPARRRALGLAGMPSWAAGMARPGRLSVVILLERVGPYPDRDLPSVLAHEVAHLMLDRALGTYRATEVPRWFDEGYAMTEAHRRGWGDRWQLGRSLVMVGRIPLARLEQGWPRDAASARAAYAQIFSFFAYVLDEAGPEAAREVVRRMSRGERFRIAWRAATGRSPEDWERAWNRSVTFRYRWIPVITSGGSLWLVISLLFVAAFVRKRRRTRRLLERWEEEERFEGPREPLP